MKRTALKRKTPLKARVSLLTRSGLKKVSGKQRRLNASYNQQRAVFLGLRDRCEVEDCRNESMQVHHMKGRDGALMLDESHWLAVCSECHRMLHDNPTWAYERGYMASRHTKRDSE